jgi:RND family efflux transporter MFP subunit
MMEKQNTNSPYNSTLGGEQKFFQDPKLAKKRISSIIIPWGITGFLVVIIIAVIVFTGLKKVEEPPPKKKKLANVEVVTINTREHREALTLPALIEADRVATIKPEFSGTLARWFFPEGAYIERGEVVAELDTEYLMANLEELEASLKTASKNVSLVQISIESAKVGLENAQKHARIQELVLRSAEANYELADSDFNRFQDLEGKNVIQASKLDTVRNALTQAELSVARAKEGINSANLSIHSAEVRIKETIADEELATARLVELEAAIANLEVKINKYKLKTPISGRLEEHLVEPGEVVTAGVQVARIYDLKNLQATINVPDRYISFLDPKNLAAKSFIQMNMPGAEQHINAKLTIPGLPKLTGGTAAGVELNAEIARIAQSSDPESNTFRVELRLPNPGGVLRHGIIGRGKIEYLYYPHAIIIPMKAVQVTDAGPRVLVVEETEGAQLAKVLDIEPIKILGSELLIGTGLAEGDRLIVTGWKGLVGGETVNVVVEDGHFKPQS